MRVLDFVLAAAVMVLLALLMWQFAAPHHPTVKALPRPPVFEQ
jgi:hypothetical protein